MDSLRDLQSEMCRRHRLIISGHHHRVMRRADLPAPTPGRRPHHDVRRNLTAWTLYAEELPVRRQAHRQTSASNSDKDGFQLALLCCIIPLHHWRRTRKISTCTTLGSFLLRALQTIPSFLPLLGDDLYQLCRRNGVSMRFGIDDLLHTVLIKDSCLFW